MSENTVKVPFGEMLLMEGPFKWVAVDLIGPLSPVSDRGNLCILAIVDFATRYLEPVALPWIEAERVAEALLELFCRLGVPQQILSSSHQMWCKR